MKPSDIQPPGFDPSNPATYRETCPYCKAPCECDLVHNGVGYVQAGPFHCEACGASEIGHEEGRELSEEERRTGWYAPGADPSPFANVIAGRIVTHEEMQAAYRAAFGGRAAWQSKETVKAWFEAVRKAPDAG